MNDLELISLHGGHSGQFCQHAKNSLAEIAAAYAARGFAWAGLTEHMPPPEDRFCYPDEVKKGLTAEFLNQRFADYMTEARRLQKEYEGRLRLLVGFETETYTGAIPHIQKLMETYRPDYIVGSVHHTADINFDFSPSHYASAVKTVGGIRELYFAYFDEQLAMIEALRPLVVGHFDLVRIYDPKYSERLKSPEIKKKIDRNLSAIKDLGLILDFNVRALEKGASEPYLSYPILMKALALEIPVIPGDDSHGVDTVGKHIDTAINTLVEMEADTRWEEILSGRF